MENEVNIQKGALYKIKYGKQYNKVEEHLSPYIRVYDYVTNELHEEDKEHWYVLFQYVFKDDLEPTSMIMPMNIIELYKFNDFFELYMDYKEVNKLIFKLQEQE